MSDFSRTPDVQPSALANAANVRSTSSAVVRQLETESLIAGRPSQVVPLIHASPPDCTAASVRVVVASSAKRKSTWFRTTSFSTSQPGNAAIRSANELAWSQQRSTRSETPERPSARIAAYTGTTGDARLAAYAALDRDLTRAAPFVVYGNSTVREFVSDRIGCPIQSAPAGGLNLTMLCLKK